MKLARVFPKSRRLLKSSDFMLMKKQSKTYKGHGFKIIARETNHSCSRLGLAVSSRVGNAVKRNRIKRIAREVFRLSAPLKSFDYLFIPYKSMDVDSLRNSLTKVFSSI